MDAKKIQDNIVRFENIMLSISRKGIPELLHYIKNMTDFYKAPASTKYHLSCEGGLLQHSLNVYDCLIAKKQDPIWKPILCNIPDESLIIISLLHDICKANFYVKSTRNQKTYDPDKIATAFKSQIKHDDMGYYIWETVPTYIIEDSMPLGHGEKSVIIITRFIPLDFTETFAIRWHMGFSDNKDQMQTIGKAMEQYPIILALYEADMEATKLLEDSQDNKEVVV